MLALVGLLFFFFRRQQRNGKVGPGTMIFAGLTVGLILILFIPIRTTEACRTGSVRSNPASLPRIISTVVVLPAGGDWAGDLLETAPQKFAARSRDDGHS